MIQLYAITDHPGPALRDMTRLTTVATERLAAVCAPAGPAEMTPDALWRHEQVVEALMEDRDLLPVRYGTRLESGPAVARALADRHDELLVALDRVRGAVELSVRVALGADLRPVSLEPESGAGYMRARARSGRAREAALRTVHEPLSILARDSSATSARPGELLRTAYLVDRAAVPGFTSLVGRLQGANPRLQLLCTGPWPAYSFAGR